MPARMQAWRAMTEADLGAVRRIADALHPGHPERPEVFAERLALAPEGCFLLTDDDGGALGLALSHPWRRDAPPALDVLLGTLPDRPDAWHIHDVALLPAARGGGHVPTLLARITGIARARGVAALTLVAVGGTEALWARFGFVARDAPGPALASYGAGAVLMMHPLGPPPPG